MGELFYRAKEFTSRTAVIRGKDQWSYRELLEASAHVASNLLGGQSDLNGARIAYLVPPGFEHAAIQWGIWRAGGVGVPLALSHPEPELDYVIGDSGASVVVYQELTDRIIAVASGRKSKMLSCREVLSESSTELPVIEPQRRAMILYTSGTTSRPKGVVTTHANIEAQVRSLVDSWEWTSDDHILNVLPLHHVHGIINVLTCALYSGAKCEFLHPFDVGDVWERFARADLTLFMAVPTVYSKLIAAWESADTRRQRLWSEGCRSMRLMVSGSAALPVSTLEQWRSITGHVLLERYGMTEIGMALSNPLHGQRHPGCVGAPLPGMDVRRRGPKGEIIRDDEPGEIQVRGPSVFLEYWKRETETAEAFVDGWFRTGDIAVVRDGVYRILGRSSVDIIKTGGYKVSALEIEEVLRTHPDIQECAVAGTDNEQWGQCVSAAIVLRADQRLTLDQLRHWTKQRLAVYKTPTRMILVKSLPRNAMGKVQKPAIVKLFEAQPDQVERTE